MITTTQLGCATCLAEPSTVNGGRWFAIALLAGLAYIAFKET